MLKIIATLSAFVGLALIPATVTEPETPQAMAFHAARDHMMKIVRDSQALAAAKLAADVEAARKKKRAINNLVTYLERKWKRPRAELSQIVALSFSQSQQAWPQPLDVLAVIQVESGFNQAARDSSSGSVGLMQINLDNPGMTEQVAAEVLTSSSRNVAWGIRLLRRYRSEMRSEAKALVAYNQGPVSAATTCAALSECSTAYTVRIALAKEELQRHFH